MSVLFKAYILLFLDITQVPYHKIAKYSVFDILILENMTLKISFTIELLFSGIWIISGHHEKEFTNKIPIPLMYTQCIWMWLQDFNSLGQECGLFCVKFLFLFFFLHLGHVLTYYSTLCQYPAHQASNFNLFCVATILHCILPCMLSS